MLFRSKTIPLLKQAGLPAVRQGLRDQQAILRLAPEEAVAAIPVLAGSDPEARVRILSGLERLFALDDGILNDEGNARMDALRKLLAPGKREAEGSDCENHGLEHPANGDLDA